MFIALIRHVALAATGFYFFSRKKSKQPAWPLFDSRAGKAPNPKNLLASKQASSLLTYLMLLVSYNLRSTHLPDFILIRSNPPFTGSFTWSTVVLHQLLADSFSPTGFPAHKIEGLFWFKQFWIGVIVVSFTLILNLYC